MKVKTVVETPDGAVEYTANLNSLEVQTLLEYAINRLLAEGVIPFTVVEKVKEASMLPMSEVQH